MKLKKLKRTTHVKIENKGEYLLLMELLEKAGYKWNSGSAPTHFNEDGNYYNSIEISIYSDMTICKTEPRVSISKDAVPLKKVIKFEVGDKVRIREDLDEFDKNESPLIVPHMLNYAGEICKITDIYRNNKTKRYTLESTYYRWLKKWIEPVLPEVEEETEPVFEDGKLYKFDYEKYCESVSYPTGLDGWPGHCKDRIVKVENKKHASCNGFGIEPKWCVEVDLKVGDFVKITNNTNPIHHFPIGQIVKVKGFPRENKLFLEGYCEDRKEIDTQIVHVEDIQIC